MADSPMSEATAPVTVSVKLGGKAIDENVSIVSIIASTSINQIATAEVELFLPHDSRGITPFSLARDEDFTPGKAIEIAIGKKVSSKE